MALRVMGGADHPQYDVYSCSSNNHNKRHIDIDNGEHPIFYSEQAGGHPMSGPEPEPRSKRHRPDNFAYEAAFRAKLEPVIIAPEQPFFVVLKENGISRQSTPESVFMERTASGHSIRPDPTEHRSAATELLEDDEAAARVREHVATFRRRFPDSKHERILRSIINPRGYSYGPGHGGPDMESAYPLDNNALESIFSAANEVFFNGRLSQRVAWDWSHESSSQYDSKVIGTTALRRAVNHASVHPNSAHHLGHLERRGFETLIVLSAPILRDPRYSRRLLISTFLHELIHCYMFICCGFRARHCGGHTPGFRTIARIVDDWAGPEAGLHLSKVEAELELFQVVSSLPGSPGHDGGVHDDARDEHRDEDGEWRDWSTPPFYQEEVGGPPQILSHRQYDNVIPCSGFINITEQKQRRLQMELQLQREPFGRTQHGFPLQHESTQTWWRRRDLRSLHGSEDDSGSPIRY